MILRPVRPRIALRPAHNKTARGVDIVFRLFVQQLGGNDRADHMLQNIFAHRLHLHLRSVLGGNDHSVHTHGPVALVFHSHLASCRPGADSPACRPCARPSTALASLCASEMGSGISSGVSSAGVAEHHALIARAGRPRASPGRSRPWRYRAICSSTCGKHGAGVARQSRIWRGS